MNCTECGELKAAPVHDPANWNVDGDGHPFDDTPDENRTRAAAGSASQREAVTHAPAPRPDPLRNVRPMTESERAAAPPKMGETKMAISTKEQKKLKCTKCGELPVMHRGRSKDHPFTHPDFKSRAGLPKSSAKPGPKPKHWRSENNRTIESRRVAGEAKLARVLELSAAIERKRREIDADLEALKELLG